MRSGNIAQVLHPRAHANWASQNHHALEFLFDVHKAPTSFQKRKCHHHRSILLCFPWGLPLRNFRWSVMSVRKQGREATLCLTSDWLPISRFSGSCQSLLRGQGTFSALFCYWNTLQNVTMLTTNCLMKRHKLAVFERSLAKEVKCAKHNVHNTFHLQWFNAQCLVRNAVNRQK